MKTISGFLAATLLSLACITTQAAETDKDATASTASATAIATTKPAKAEKDEDAIPQALIDASRRSFVVIQTHLKKDTSEPLSADEDNYRVSQMYSEYVDQKRPDETPGLILDTKGRVLIVDTGLDDRYIDRLAVTAGGKSFPAKRAKLLYDAPAVILQTDANAASVLKPLKFAPLAEKGVNTVLYRSVMYKMNDQWQLQFAGVRPSLALDPDAGIDISFGNHMASTMSYGYGGGARPFIIADSDGLPVGCATAPFFDLRQKECLWLGDDLRKAEGIEWGKLVAAEKACRGKLLGAVHEVVLVLRQGESDGMSRYRSSFMSSFPDSGGSASGREISTYGLAVSDTDVVVLRPLDRKVARQIEKIYIKHSPTRRQEVQFVGAFKNIGGFCVRVTKGKLPARAELAPADPQRMRPFWQARMRKRLGEKYVDLSTNRLYGKQRGYAGKYFWYAARSMSTGSFMVDFDGRIIGAYAQERREDEEEQQLDASRRFGSPTKTSRVFTISELRDLLTKPADHLDAKIAVTTKTLAKRHAWLGVESVPVTPDLAEMLKIETPSRDGKIGFLINAVYDASPAQKMKLQVGDILLKIQGPKTPYPIELASRYARDREYYGGQWYGRGGDDDEGPLVPTWKNRENFITKAMDAVGVGKTIRITYYHPTALGTGKTKTLNYKIELAPPDQESADKWKNRKLGLTVKDVTYEVRHALSLKAPAGVIVTNVESGSPTLIAKIFPNEVITRLDEEPLTSPRQMRDLIAKARQAGRDKVRVTVLRLGKTRQADFDITEYDPADDEGLDED